ncbi:proteasome subunit alpha type-2-like isoform X2 [Rhodnius prolixus]|uniref:proteasome subunit alpha type-2-like isoform X2 n=1 Tax=Rhodnius prolixus TaxID=13249 RepID=UPI003D18DEF4
MIMYAKENTQSGFWFHWNHSSESVEEVRRFGVSIWVCEWDDGKTTFCKYDPSDAYFAWKALKEFYFLKTFLEKKGLF